MNTAVINQSPFHGVHSSNEWKGGHHYPIYPSGYHLPMQNLLPIAGLKQLSLGKTAQNKWANLRSVYSPHIPIVSPVLSPPYVALTSVKPSGHIQRGIQNLTTTSQFSTTATQRNTKNQDYRHSVTESAGDFGYLIQNLRQQESNNINLQSPSNSAEKLLSYKDSHTHNSEMNGMQEQQDFSLARKRSSSWPSGPVHSKKKMKNGQTQDDQIIEEYKNLEMDVANILISDIPFPVVIQSLSEVSKSPDTSRRGLKANVIVSPVMKSGEVREPEKQVNTSKARSTAMQEHNILENKSPEKSGGMSELHKHANRFPVGSGEILEPNGGENVPIVMSGAITKWSIQVNMPPVGNGTISKSNSGENTLQDNGVRLEAEKKSNDSGMDSNTSLQFENEKENYSKNLVNSNKVVFTCQQCVVTFESTDDLISHTTSHTNNNFTFKCNICPQVFRSTNGLQKHVEFHADHRNNFLCSFCFKPFPDRDSLEEHIISSHMSRRPHKCSYCPKAFRDPGSLQKHVRIHTGERPYKCTACEKSFAEYSSLRKHYRVHTGEQPYKCQYCPKAFSISGNLQRHILIHTGERPYKCSECSKTFNNPSHLRRHEKNLHSKLEGEK